MPCPPLSWSVSLCIYNQIYPFMWIFSPSYKFKYSCIVSPAHPENGKLLWQTFPKDSRISFEAARLREEGMQTHHTP